MSFWRAVLEILAHARNGKVPKAPRLLVSHDSRRRVAACFAMLDGNVVTGYYTLSASNIALTDLSYAVARKLPRYPTIPAVRMGRLAVELRHRGSGLGAELLVNALQRVAKSEIPAIALTLDAKDGCRRLLPALWVHATVARSVGAAFAVGADQVAMPLCWTVRTSRSSWNRYGMRSSRQVYDQPRWPDGRIFDD
jgi:GNAT superfamily N-acetyltransferase